MAPNTGSKRPFFSKPKNRQTKTHLIFDEKARKDYLMGFRKRKAERRKKFNEKLKKELKEERKRLQTELRDKIKKSNRGVPEVAHLIDEEPAAVDVYDLPEATVTISSLTDSQYRDENVFLGKNMTKQNTDTTSRDDSPVDVVDPKKQSKNMNREAMKKLQKTKAFKRVAQVSREKARKKAKQNSKKKRRK